MRENYKGIAIEEFECMLEEIDLQRELEVKSLQLKRIWCGVRKN